jgi:hypothetical protein
VSSEYNQVACCVCQRSTTRTLSYVSNPGRIVEWTEPSLFSDERQPAAALKNIKSSTLGGNYPLDLVLIRTIILGSSSFTCGFKFLRYRESRTGAGK